MASMRFKMAALLLAVAVVSTEESASKIKFESSEQTASDAALRFVSNATGLNSYGLIGGSQTEPRGVRQEKSLFDLIGLGTGPETDPYLARLNSLCLNGDLAECFKSRALATLDDIFARESFPLTENARVVRMPATQLRALHAEPYEFSGTAREDESEWDQFVKFGLRKVERFLKSNAIEVQFADDVTEYGRYSPRFIDEIQSEVDILEDKTDSKKSRLRLKKLLIPMLVILKLFKIKLLLFLPLILGLASFKKLLGFLALAIPGLIGFFRLCKPQLQSNFGSYGGGQNHYYPQPPPNLHQYSPAGVGIGGNYYGGQKYGYNSQFGSSQFGSNNYARDADAKPSTYSSGSVAFRDPDTPSTSDHFDAQQLAYQGYQQYQN